MPLDVIIPLSLKLEQIFSRGGKYGYYRRWTSSMLNMLGILEYLFLI